MTAVAGQGSAQEAILAYAEDNHVNLIIVGAATHGLQMQRFIATVPIRVAVNAPCTVMLVRPRRHRANKTCHQVLSDSTARRPCHFAVDHVFIALGTG